MNKEYNEDGTSKILSVMKIRQPIMGSTLMKFSLKKGYKEIDAAVPLKNLLLSVIFTHKFGWSFK